MKIHDSVAGIEAALRQAAIPPAILVGLCSHGLAILRSLATKGVPVVAIESEYHRPAAHSRYGIKLYHPDLYSPSLVDLLIDLGRASPHKPVLFVTNDGMVRLVTGRRDELQRHVHLSVPDARLLDELMAKDRLADLAKRQGLRIPRTWIIDMARMDARAVARLLDEVSFPCILKPAEPMSSLFKVLKPAGRREVEEALHRVRDVGRVVLQDWIEGRDDRIFFVAYYFDAEGRVRAVFSGQKIRQYMWNACAARGVYRPDLVEEGLKLFQGLGYRGLASVEFKEAPSGEPYFIEATVGRSDYNVKAAIVNGVDLPAVVYTDLTAVSIPAECRQVNRAVWVDGDRDWWMSLKSFFDPGCPKRDLLSFLFARKAYALFDPHDQVPFWRSWLPFLKALMKGNLIGLYR